MRAAALALAALAAVSSYAAADEPPQRTVTVAELLNTARAQSPSLRAKKAAMEAARARVAAAFLPEDPEFGADVEGQPDPFDFENRGNTEIMAQQTLPFPTDLLLAGMAASKEADMAYQQYRQEALTIAREIERPYYELVLARTTAATLEETKSILDQIARSTLARYESNQAPQSDLIKSQIEISQLDIELYDWRQKERVAEARFASILNEPIATRYAAAEVGELAPAPAALEELERLAVENRPELKMLEAGLERAKIGRAMEQTAWLPDVTLRYEGRQMKDANRIEEHDTGIFVSVPVWSLLKGVSGTWRAADADLEKARNEYERMRNETLYEVHEAYARVSSARYALDLYGNSILPQARQNVTVALSAYEGGKADIVDLLDAERTLREAQIRRARALADYETGLSDLRFAVGVDGPLTESGGKQS